MGYSLYKIAKLYTTVYNQKFVSSAQFAQIKLKLSK